MKKRPKKLMWKIFMFLLGFCALLIVILWVFQTTMLDTTYEKIRRNEMDKAILMVEANIDSPDLEQIFLRLQDESEIIVTPVHKFSPPNRPNLPNRHGFRQALTETKTFATADGQTKTFVFYAIVSPVNATISTIKVQLYYVTGIMLVLSVILAFIMAKTVSKPIEQLNDGAKILAGGDYNIHFSGQGYREIHELSDTLNYTASELSKVEALRRELMANISHDLRTPLALIYSYAEMMHDFPDEIAPEQTDVIMRETARLSALVGDIFDVSQLETGTMALNINRYNLTQSIGETVTGTAELVKKDGYTLVFEKNDDIYVCADAVKITQALYNLLINAIHYGGENSTVIVRQKLVDGMVRIEVEDRGVGIAAEDIPYIWNRYYKNDGAHKRAIIGTGLGLSIVKKIIDLHGGDCGVASVLGEGSTFWFTLKPADPPFNN